MGTLTAGFLLVRWELLSAVIMFFASTFNVMCRNASRNTLAFIFSGLGIGMACWFVTGLMGISVDVSAQALWHGCKNALLFILSQSPPDWQLT